MIKALKWAYKKGQQHERQRIRTLIAEFRHDQPAPPFKGADPSEKQWYKQRLAAYYESGEVLSKLIDPYTVFKQEINQIQPPIAPLDREDTL